MRKVIICLYILWAFMGISSLFWWGNIWFATSFIWLLVGPLLAFGAWFFSTSMYLERKAKKDEENFEPTCENCLHGHTADLINSLKKDNEEKEKCLGESIENTPRGKVCPHYIRR